jgi:hypothetical protein
LRQIRNTAYAAAANTASHAARTSSSSNATRTLNPASFTRAIRKPKTTAKKAATAYSASAAIVISFACLCTGWTTVASSTAAIGSTIDSTFTKL